MLGEADAELDGPGATTGVSTTTIGEGPDRLVLAISQDFYLDNALYRIAVDGEWIDGTLAASAERSRGEHDTITALGDWGAGAHVVTVAFLNDDWGGTPDTDRNLYVESIAYEGVPQADGSADLFWTMARDFAFAAPEPARIEIGAGPERLELHIAQDFHLRPAEYAIWIDGERVDGTLVASALHGLGQHDTVTIRGDWSHGPHTVAVEFLNDAWDGTPETDRNLYVEGILYQGVPQPDGTAELYANGSHDFSFVGPAPLDITLGQGPDELVLHVAQDFHLGNAEYTISVDGQPIDGVLNASSLRGMGQSDTIHVRGDWAAGPHTLTVSFLNDAWDGTPETDRNLYVYAVDYNGVLQPDSAADFYVAGPRDFTFTDVAEPPQRLVLENVPSYNWYHGCAPTAIASVFGYRDLQYYDGYFDAQGWEEIRLTANVQDQISSPAHNAKYDPNPDDTNLPVPPQTSIADFLYTSVDPLDMGWTWNSNMEPGIEQYAAYRGAPLEVEGRSFDFGLWDEVIQAILGEDPMVFLVDTDGNGGTDHAIPVFGFETREDGSRWFASYTTWHEDEFVDWFAFQPTSAGTPWGVGYIFFIDDPETGQSRAMRPSDPVDGANVAGPEMVAPGCVPPDGGVLLG